MEIKFSKQALTDIEDMPDAQEFIDEIQKIVEDGSLFEKSEPVDIEKMREEEPDIYALLMQALSEVNDEDILN